MNRAYHFTDTCRLPFIVQTGELRPGINEVHGFPPDVLWATTSANGDRTATAAIGSNLKGFRDGATRRVRITLASEDFEPWMKVIQRLPRWTAHHVQILERAALNLRQSTASWLCRDEPLSMDRFIAIETRSWTSAWSPLPVPAEAIPVGNGFAVRINGRLYGAVREIGPKRVEIYSAFKVENDPVDMVSMFSGLFSPSV